jgi:cytochrome c-type biogenesis protein CcmH/NrfG
METSHESGQESIPESSPDPASERRLGWWWRQPARPLLLGLCTGAAAALAAFAAAGRPRAWYVTSEFVVQLATVCAVTVVVSYVFYVLARRSAD